MTSTTVGSPPLQSVPTTVSVAIIGTEGAGKTVLTTVLARRFRSMDAQGIYLEPQDGATLQYVERVWATLNDYDWPPSTLPANCSTCGGNWRPKAGFACSMSACRRRGARLRYLFGNEQAGTEGLPKHLQLLTDYCQSADIVIYLVNLKDFAGEADPQKRVANESAIKSAVDYLNRLGTGHSKHMCLVFTQIDQYREIEQQYGGSWRQVGRFLPYVFSARQCE